MKRKGFTLIELMVVIAIIIILAAIAIPNYLKMTERAKRSRVASDMATLATVLETFKTDWGAYPISSAAFQDLSSAATTVHIELAGIGAADTATTYNTWGSTNAVGEKNPAAGACIEYIKTGTLTSMINPWGQATNMMYGSNGGGNKWLLYMNVDAATWLIRTDASSTITTVTVLPVNPA